MPAPAYSIDSPVATATVRVGRGSTPAWTTLTGLPRTMDFPSQMPSDDDITTFSSPGFAEENAPGILPAVDYSIDMLLDAGSAGDTALRALNARDPVTFAKELHLLEVSANGTTVTNVAYLKEYRAIPPINNRASVRATWRIMAVVANATPPAPEPEE